MPSGDRRSVGELLADSDLLARELLADPAAEVAAGLVRSWPGMIQAAVRVWAALPTALAPAEVDPMARLAGIGAGVGQNISRAAWPGPGLPDERLFEVGANLARAAFLVERYGGDVQPTTPAVRGDLAAARARVIHTLYVATHATTIAVRTQAAYQEHESHRRRPRGRRVRTAELRVLEALADRLTSFEEIASRYVTSHPVTMVALGEVRAEQPPGRLPSVLQHWDAQVHRTFGSRVDLPDVVRVARVNALVASATGALAAAAGDLAVADRPAAARLSDTAGSLEVVWTQLAELTGQFVGPDARTDPLLVRAAAGTRAAVRDVACGPIGFKQPQQLTDPSNLLGIVQALQQSLASSIDVAYLVSDMAADPARLTTTARSSRAPAAEASKAGLLESTQPHATSPGSGRLAVMRRPLPSDARDEIDMLVATAVSASRRAASITLEPEQTRELSGPSQQRRRTRPQPMPAHNRSVRTAPAPFTR
ncbi:hypothetical protein SAMN04488543_2753 [Friedmanniella luteola]|uniref:Uncharacterized protein n=1 Tax=Friedmanniella luteola TaxID=546871 RepID=A0A1H1WJ77_9ACTN|nr:hypothetical protein [Friedmanniella luteola]SDS97367.1 hypothetical protein SAMN04488543_2753 [Friedmanniella luteola]